MILEPSSIEELMWGLRRGHRISVAQANVDMALSAIERMTISAKLDLKTNEGPGTTLITPRQQVILNDTGHHAADSAWIRKQDEDDEKEAPY